MKSKREIKGLNNGFLKPEQEVFKIEGSVLYQESAQAWNTIKIKRELLFLFPQLRNKSVPVKYNMLVPRSAEQIRIQVEEMIKSDQVPILLSFEQEEKPQDTIA